MTNTARSLRARKARRGVANWLLAVATTLATIALIGQWLTSAFVDDATFNETAPAIAAAAPVRNGMAGQLVTAAGGTGDPALVARALDENEIERLVVDAREYVLHGGAAPRVELSSLAPSIDPTVIGAQENQEVAVVLQLPSAGWLETWLPLIRTWAALLALLCVVLALAVTPVRYIILRSAGRWSFFAGTVSALAVAFLPGILAGTGSSYLVVLGLLSKSAATSIYPLQGVMVALGAGGWVGGRTLQRRVTALSQAAANQQLRDEFPLLTAVPAEPVKYWERANHPLGVPTFEPSELTEALSTVELRDLAEASARAWVMGKKADEGDAEALSLLLEDRGTYVQVARLWEQHRGEPAKCATLLLAYQDLSLYAPYYAELLDLAEAGLHVRVGVLGDSLAERGLNGACSTVADVYRELSVLVDADGGVEESRRLNAIAARLS